MSMKLDENSFNLKEKAEIKGGGIPKWIDNGLPYGVINAPSSSIQIIIDSIPNINIKYNPSLIQIIKKPNTLRGKSETFNKFNNLFGDEKTGKSLQFLKASFFKTDNDTIYTYSEHRTPMELVEDFSEYYKIELERLIVSGVKSRIEQNNTTIKAFVTLINIIYLLCKKIKGYLDDGDREERIKVNNTNEYLCVKRIIELLDEKKMMIHH